MKQRIYIVDDEPKLGDLFVTVLRRDGYDARSFVDPNALLDYIDEQGKPDVVLSDLMMPSMNGIELLEALKKRKVQVPMIIMTAHSSVSTAVEAMQQGAFHYLQKPVNLEEMRELLKKALARNEHHAPVRHASGKTPQRLTATPEYPVEGILGESPGIATVRETIRTLRDIPHAIVLIRGETGTGKNHVAKTIHHTSTHHTGRFMEINCAALPDNLLEAELFGYEKGAFTDARNAKPGLLEVADGGTLFLDEIDSMSMALQAKLLSFLESRTFRRLGGVEDLQVSTRILCATNAMLEDRVRERAFRKDLYFRINVVNMYLPPLARMGDDVLLIAESLLQQIGRTMGRAPKELTEATRDALRDHAWPGNVRELRNVLERAMIFSKGAVITPDDLNLLPIDLLTGNEHSRGNFRFQSGCTLEDLERAYILHTLKTTDTSYAEVADMLGISKKTLWEKRKRYNLDEELKTA